MILRGYRHRYAALLSGLWLPGELLGLPLTDRPAFAQPATVEPPVDRTVELCVVPDTAFVRFVDIDWVARRARMETGLQSEAGDSANLLVTAAVSHAFRVLNLHRVYGWVTPATGVAVSALQQAGFQREATIPDGNRCAGRTVDREIWGAIHA